MGFADFYFQKFCQNERKIKEPVPANLSCIITIPCFKEKQILKALQSLYFCSPTLGNTEVIVILNYPQNRKDDFAEFHTQQFEAIKKWVQKHKKENLKFHIILEALPHKDAGVGLARKIAMDEAVRRFQDIENPNGVIVGFDADCTCSTNYLRSIEECFSNPLVNACSINFEHPYEGIEHDPEIYQAIIYYELYLRYYVEALRYVKFPFAYHTLGSSFAVRAETYIRQGGMNKRKAGEDFYFLHKVIPQGGFAEINDCTVYPSPRTSDRVPFGTGAAVNKIVNHNDFDFLTFCPEAFYALKYFFEAVPLLYNSNQESLKQIVQQLHISIQSFLIKENFLENLLSINNRCNQKNTFEKAFYSWFNGLMVLQYLNFAHGHYFQKSPVSSVSLKILKEKYQIDLDERDCKRILEIFRQIQKKDRISNLPQ